jgi:predicted helicase
MVVETLLHTKTEIEARSIFKLCSQNQWQYIRAKSELEDRAWHKDLTPVLYRPFDVRWTVYNRNVAVHRRERAMNHMHNGNNLALVTSRFTKGEIFQHTQVTSNITEVICMSPKTSNNGFVFPLYLYPNINQSEKLLLEEQRRPNLSPEVLKAIDNNLGYTPIPESIFYYIYAVLHSPTYRTRYSEYLKRDFPCIPLTSNDKLFRQLADYGEQLVQLHLMTSPKLDNLITKFVEGTGKRTVASGHPKYKDGAVHINTKGDKFTEVPEEVWNFYVGGYQPCQKWLKDRKGRTLSDEDILHYQKIVVALKETIELMTKIDEAIPGFPIQ